MSTSPCPQHPDEVASACCSRCGDFFCALCQAKGGSAPELCPRCRARQRAPVRLPQGLRLLIGGLGAYGALSSLFNVLLVAMGLVSIISVFSGDGQFRDSGVQITLGIGLSGLLGLTAGILFILSAHWLSRLERRTGVQAAVGVGTMLGLLTGVCGVVGVGLLIWALIYLNRRSTKQLFGE